MDNETIHSVDEWSPLEEVVVGRADGFRGYHMESSFNLGCWENLQSYIKSEDYFVGRGQETEPEWPFIEIPQRILQELQEDIEGFVNALEQQGVRVRRPEAITGNYEIKTPLWESYQSPPLNIRDFVIILGSTIVETAPDVRSRLFENDYLKPLFYEYFNEGAAWIEMPRPALAKGSLDSSYFDWTEEERQAISDHHVSEISGLGFEMIFSGAQCLRLGEDVLVNVSNRNHELGFRWMTQVLGDKFTFHRIEGMADCHIDSTLLPLREGVWLARSKDLVSCLPEPFNSWDVVVAPPSKTEPEPVPDELPFSISSQFLDMNVLSLDKNTVIVNSLHPELIDVLEENGFDVVPVQHRHGRLFGGGFHCFTLDVKRDCNDHAK